MITVVDIAIKIADQLIGTCDRSLDDVIEEVCDELDVQLEIRRGMALAVAIDERVFCCDRCGWYCSTDELNNLTDEDLCDDCHTEDDE